VPENEAHLAGFVDPDLAEKIDGGREIALA